MTKEERGKVIVWLDRYKHAMDRITSIEGQQAYWRDKMDQLRAQHLTGMPGSKGGRSDRLEKSLDKISELDEQMSAWIAESCQTLMEITVAIDSVQDTRYHQLLTLRYIDRLKWEEICVRMNYEWRWIHRLHDKALIELKEATKSHHEMC